MIVLPCLDCSFAIRVIGDPKVIEPLVGRQSSFWPDRYACPRCDKPVKGLLEIDVDPRVLAALDVQDLSPEEAFATACGCGVPEDQHCDLATVRTIFDTMKVARVVGSDVRGADRAVIEFLEFEDGSRLYLGASPAGAVAYRLSRPHAYTDKVLNELDKTDPSLRT